jgi:hypothetical protein
VFSNTGRAVSFAEAQPIFFGNQALHIENDLSIMEGFRQGFF